MLNPLTLLQSRSPTARRWARIVVSLFVVIAAYWCYAIIVTPLIEPRISGGGDTLLEGEKNRLISRMDLRLEAMKDLFPADSWVLDKKEKPFVIELDKIRVLWKSYKTRGDKSVFIQPCTMVMIWDGAAEDETQRRRQSIILEAPEGAVLRFDSPIDLKQFKFSRLVGGSLIGEIRIRSDCKEPGPEDDLDIRTRDVELTDSDVWTENAVTFRWGKTFGAGSGMHVKLQPKPGSENDLVHGPQIAGIELFEMRKVERLHVEMPRPEAPAGMARSGGSPLLSSDEAYLPAEISCQGAFCFNVLKNEASFSDQVNVIRAHPQGGPDQLTADKATLYFAAKNPNAPNGSQGLEPERVKAEGKPALLLAPTRKIVAQGESMECNLKSQAIALDGTTEVILRQADNEIRGRKLQYQSGANGGLGQAYVQGPGRFHTEASDRSAQKVDASWDKELVLKPEEGEHAVRFTGNASLNYVGSGRLQAEEISFWLQELEKGGANNPPKIKPNRMLAKRNVRIDSPQIAGAVEQMEIWFEQVAATAMNGGVLRTAFYPDAQGGWESTNGGVPQPGAYLNPSQQRQGMATTAPVAGQVNPQIGGQRRPNPVAPWLRGIVPQGVRQIAPAPQAALQAFTPQFSVTAQLLRGLVVLGGKETQVAELTLQNNVRAEERLPQGSTDKPVIMTGDHVKMTNATSPQSTMTLVGQPAHFEARGVSVTSSNINLDRGNNHLKIVGAGRMDLPAKFSLMARPSATSDGNLIVEWVKGMDFDGREMTFQERVVATTPEQRLETQTLIVRLKQALRFADPQLRPQGDMKDMLEEVLCHGGAFVESREWGPDRQLKSLTRFQAPDLAVNLANGQLSAGGPGWMNAVRYGKADTLTNPRAALIAGPIGGNANGTGNVATTGDALVCLNVRFQGGALGSIQPQQLRFKNQIRMAYGTVDSWDATLQPDSPHGLGPSGVLMHCDEATVSQTPASAFSGGAAAVMEFMAEGNTVIEGETQKSETFTARANRISYAQAKGMLIIEGDGRNPAKLYLQEQVGGAMKQVAARTINYWLATKKISMSDTQAIEIQQ